MKVFSITEKYVPQRGGMDEIPLMILIPVIIVIIIIVIIVVLYIIYYTTKTKTTEKNALLIKNIYNTLKKYNVCYLSGAIIFEDFNNNLFNLLTHDEISNEDCLIKSNPSKFKKPKTHFTYTHKDVLENTEVKTDECLSFNKTNKLEIHFDDINYLCDLNTKDELKDKKNKVTKRILLYYRFKHNNKSYLFFKLENHGMNDPKHILSFIASVLNIKETTSYDVRNEYAKYKPNYINTSKTKDIEFYKKFSSDNNLTFNSNIIDYYDNKLRTGNELFIPEDIKNILIKQ